MFFKKKKKSDPDSKPVLGMILLSGHESFNRDLFFTDYKTNYEHNIGKFAGDDAALSFDVDGEMASIGHMTFPVPQNDIISTAEYAYNWETAVEDLQVHQTHLIVFVSGNGADPINRYKIFTRVICSLIRTSSALGVYMGQQSLLIPKDVYLEEAAMMCDDYLPLNLWIYFGLRITDEGYCGYTYGLEAFNKHNMEVLNSQQGLGSIREFLLNITHYVLYYDVTFEDGQTCGMSVEEKIKISFSKGKLVEGKTFKLAY